MSIPNYNFQGTKHGIQISTISTINTDLDHLHDSFLHQGHEDEEEDDEEEEEELIRVILRRNPLGLSACFDGKVRKTSSMRAEDEKQSSSISGIEKAVRRAFSMRASASANEVYRRIDHQYDPVPVPVADEENTIMAQSEIQSDHKKRNKIHEACRRFFGF